MPQHKPFVAIVGSQNSGKSTVIRSLTGARTGQFRGVVRDLATREFIVIIGSSPQEQALSRRKLIGMLKRAKRSGACRGVICALQPSFPRTRLSLEDVFQEARDLQFKIHAYVVDPGYKRGSGYSQIVKARLRKVGVRARTLDGRRFAQINAATINRHTRLAA